MRLPKTKEIPYGEGKYEKLSVRIQNHQVRIQDMKSGALYLLDPAIARRFAAALTYSAHHAEIYRLPTGEQDGKPASTDQRVP